jgi:bile acid:Na+ symporter, BASS family
VSKPLKQPSHYVAGLILVSCCPRGSKQLCDLFSKGLSSKLTGQYVAVDLMGLFISTSEVVLAPVLLGALLNQYCNGLV